MTWEAAFWVGLALLVPTLVKALSDWLERRRPTFVPLLRAYSPWICGLLIPYLALLNGAVLGRDAGLYGHSLDDWMRGGLVSAALLLVGFLAGRRWRFPPSTGSSLEAALDEPRWALYRAAGRLLTGVFWSGVLVGLGLAAVEWLLRWRPWRRRGRADRAGWANLLRIGTSAAVFGLSGNLWLTVITQVVLLGLVQRSRS